MKQNHMGFEQEHDSLKDVVEFQNNMYNPGHYIGTGRVPPTVSAPGNATPLAIFCFFAFALFLTLGLLLLFSDTSSTLISLIKSPITNKVVTFILLVILSLLFLLLGFGYLKKAKRYHKEKRALESEDTNESTEDQIWQRTCPKCGDSHDIDYPKCPKCKHNYLK